VRPRHSDTDLLELAQKGSAPAFASLLHRHRDIIQRGALRAEHPERIAESAMVAAMRSLRRGRADGDDLRGWLDRLVEGLTLQDPGRPGVERLLPTDWFDRTWVQVAPRWPRGRRSPRVPRWAWQLAGAVGLALGGASVTYFVVTADPTSEVLSELVAEPIEDPDTLAVPGPVVEQQPEDTPELFGDIELGEIPTYDLTGEDDRDGARRPTIAPPAAPRPGEDPMEGETIEREGTTDAG
jgi:hypothetical protein